MGTQVKYIVFKDPCDNEHMIIFNALFDHSAIAEAMKHCPTHCLEPVSAGQVHFADDMCSENYCHGASTTLKLSCRPELDDLLLRISLKV
jgi:ferredoxin-like protein FixX